MKIRHIFSLVVFFVFAGTVCLSGEEPYWLEPMKEVHEGFDGTKNYVAQYGDSITNSMAFWSVFDWSDPSKYMPEDGLPKKPEKKRWRDIIKGCRAKGGGNANGSGWRVGNLLTNVPKALDKQKPEVAIIMIGTNDIRGGSVPGNYKAGLEKVVDMCIEKNCVPILSTIPPMKDRDKAVADCNKIIKAVALAKKVPLIEYHAAIIERRPQDWLGTLVSNDGVHPTAGKTNDYSEANLKISGYGLRNYVSFLKYREVYFKILTQGGATEGAGAAGTVKDSWNWPAKMLTIAKKYKGPNGKVVPLGDSITYANQAGRYARYGKSRTPAENDICKWMKADKNDKSNGWFLAADDQPSGRSWTAASGVTSGQYLKGGKGGLPPLDNIIKQHNPQIALILLGTNDLSAKVPPSQFLSNMETIYTRLMANGTIPVVQTVPPTTWDKAGKIGEYNKGLVNLAKKHGLPLIDVYGEFLARQPGDAWQGTLISKDGAHPTHAAAQGPATEENLKSCGHLLRCWLSIQKVIEVKKKVIDRK
ncbi:SGNH/GDSL hydrolase family protein [Planctomycetota bacterium]